MLTAAFVYRHADGSTLVTYPGGAFIVRRGADGEPVIHRMSLFPRFRPLAALRRFGARAASALRR